MSDVPFFVPALQRGKIADVDHLHGPDTLSIRVISGVLASAGKAYLLKGEIMCRDSPTDPQSLVAIKVILNLSTGESPGERIRRELAVVKHVRHPYILPYVGVFSTDVYTLIVSVFMDDGNLLEYLKMNPVKREPLIFQIAIAVNYLHVTDGIVHGDLKCENVLVSHDGKAQLADFGFSTPAEKSRLEDTTAMGIRLSNTLRFAAPELLLDDAKASSGKIKSKTTQADVYAFGMLVLQAFSGERPWPGVDDQGVIIKVADEKATHPRLPSATAAGLSNMWWKLCQDCWQYKPEKRPSMLDVETRIHSITGLTDPEQIATAGTGTESRAQTPTGGARFRWPWSKSK